MRTRGEFAAFVHSHASQLTVVVGDRRGKVRDASNARGEVAVSIDILPSESPNAGAHYEGSAHDVVGMGSVWRGMSFYPCEHQVISQGIEMAAIKASDGRMLWRLLEWLRVWCMRALCFAGEQPDVYLPDFYDAPYMVTDPTEWGSTWQKRTLLFVRGSDFPTPPHERTPGSLDWHRRVGGGGVAQAHMRDETPDGFALGLAEQIRPNGCGVQPDFEVERERLVYSWWLAGLPVVPNYDTPDGRPPDQDTREYLHVRGVGDGRRLGDGVIPLMARMRDAPTVAPQSSGGVSVHETHCGVHAVWSRPSLEERLRGVRPPTVSKRGAKLAAAVARLKAKEAAAGAISRAHTVVDVCSPASDLVVVIPVRRVAGKLLFLVPAESPSRLLGAPAECSAGHTSAQRKQGGLVATAVASSVLGDVADEYSGESFRTSAAMYITCSGVEMAVFAAWVPPAAVDEASTAGAGMVWLAKSHIAGEQRRRLSDLVAWTADGWTVARCAPPIAGRTGAVPAAPTTVDERAAAPTIDAAQMKARLERDLAVFRGLMEEAAHREPRLESHMLAWAGKVDSASSVLPPESVVRQARAPNVAEWARRPFSRPCRIPTTEAMPQRWPPPRWPPGVPRPVDAISTYRPKYRPSIRSQIAGVCAWNASRVAGRNDPRPPTRCWSDCARLPWYQGRVMSFVSGPCELLGAGGPALEPRMSRAALLWQFRHYPHRRLLSYGVHGVRLADTLPLDTMIAPNLLSMYDVVGGPDAIADETHVLKLRGWQASSAGVGAVPGEPRALTSPMRWGPRGMVARKDGGPPRGVAEDGHPRKLELTEDSGEVLDSLNNSSGDRVGLNGPDREAFPLDEVKPRISHANVNFIVIWALAHLLGVSPILILFDYKYFFHCLVHEMAEIWKRGFAVPARRPKGGAHKTLLDVLLELVMAMGWTRASLIAQDLANALVWRLGQLVDEELADYVAKLLVEVDGLPSVWAARAGIPHDEYGSHATLQATLQYTDDQVTGAAGPVVAATVCICFSRLIGPEIFESASAAESARGTARRHAALLRGDMLVKGVARQRRGSISAIGRSACAPPGARVISAGRVGPGGNPYIDPDAARAATGFACLLACGEVKGAVADVGELRRLRVHRPQAIETESSLWGWLRMLQQLVGGQGEHVVLRCGCDELLQGGSCHCPVICAHVEQQLDIAEDVARGPPADPVCSAPVPAQGLNMEAAKEHKWHVAGDGIWLGYGQSATLLVNWIPQSKAAALLYTSDEVLAGRCDIQAYRTYVGALQDTVTITGGGQYRMKGMHAPFMAGAEADQGANTLVVPRPQMKARITAHKRVLANCPGASMLAATGRQTAAADETVWEIRGDAAKEDRGEREGLGSFWYGLWWWIPLDDVEGMRELHITCIELIEVGLGVVTVGPLLQFARRVRLVSDAMAAVATLRARMADGRIARDARSWALVAVHEVIMARPEWIALHEPTVRAEVAQQYGETLLLDDAASRGKEAVIRDTCAALQIRPRRWHPLPARSMSYLHEAVSAAREAMHGGADSSPAGMGRGDPVVGTTPHPYGVEAIEYMSGGSSASGLARAMQLIKGESAPMRAAVPADAGGAEADAPLLEAASRGLTGAKRGHGADGAHQHSRGFSEVVNRSRTTLGAHHSAATFLSPTGSLQPSHSLSLARGLREAQAGEPSLAVQPLPAQRPVVVAARCTRPATILEEAQAARRVGLAARAELLASTADADDMERTRRLLLERSMVAMRSNEDGLGVTGGSDEMLRGLLAAAQRAMDRRFAPATRRLDKSYWRFWLEWTELIGTPPLRTNAAANAGGIPHLYMREVGIALGALMAWVADNPQYKIESMLARLRGVARRHVRLQLTFVSLSAVVMASEGLIQEHIDVHGADSLLPSSKEPFEYAEIIGMLLLPHGTRVKGYMVGPNLDWQGVRVFLALYATMGPRKEAIALGIDEVFGPRKLSLWSVTYRFGGLLVRAPTRIQMLSPVMGDRSYITPCPCKNDKKGDKFGNNPVPSAWHPTRPICLMRELLAYELMRNVPPERRRLEPLVLGPGGVSWTKSALDAFFKALLAFVARPERARRLSIHSFRVWLACALLAAGATPEQIMLLLRWSSEAARKLYARLGEGTQTSLISAAHEAPIDSVRSHTLLLAGGAGMEARAVAEAQAVQRAEGLLEAAHDVTGPLPPASALPCAIDDDNVIMRLRNDHNRLSAAARRADEAMALGDEAGEADSEVDE